MQNPNRKNTDWFTSLKQDAAIYGEQFAKFMFGIAAKLGTADEVAKKNYSLGLMHLNQGNFSDAIFRFKAVTWLQPQNADAWYYLGIVSLADEQKKMAVAAFSRAKKLRPDYEEAAYMFAIARGKNAKPDEMPQSMPLTLALNHFEGIAPTYEESQLGEFNYQGHTLVAAAIRKHATKGRVDYTALDLGVGTGLCGPLVKDITAEITGVDISEIMLQKAITLKDGSDKVYNALIKRDAREFLTESPDTAYDLIIACGLFSFMGDLQQTFAEIARGLRTGGLFVFTAEMMEGDGFQLDPDAGLFRFSEIYLKGLATNNGLTELSFEEVEVYPNHKQWLCVYKK
ncbi:MAG: methyltransferase domain-containing protein [Rickettsiales bacterium]